MDVACPFGSRVAPDHRPAARTPATGSRGAQHSVQILPLGAGHIIGTLYVLTLPDGARGTYTEGFFTGNYSEDIETVMTFQRVYDRLAASALTSEASTDSIHEALKRLQ